MSVISRTEAIARLTRRYNEQAERDPTLPNKVALQTYIAANVERVRANGMLEPYAREGDAS